MHPTQITELNHLRILADKFILKNAQEII